MRGVEKGKMAPICMFVWAYICVLGGAQLQPMKFGEDQTMYGEVISDLFDHQQVAL